jgi:hypothetical protein
MNMSLKFIFKSELDECAGRLAEVHGDSTAMYILDVKIDPFRYAFLCSQLRVFSLNCCVHLESCSRHLAGNSSLDFFMQRLTGRYHRYFLVFMLNTV